MELGAASGPELGFTHQALIYGSDEEFVDVALPFVREGIEAGEHTLVAVQRANVENLREALGPDADGAVLLSVEEWYETSARTRDKFAIWVEGNLHGGRARLIGEPPWVIGHPAQVRDWARHESVINLAFQGTPLTFMCPYDARVLPDDILDHARATHPEIVERRGMTPSGAYESPSEFCRRLDDEVSSPDSVPSTQIIFELADLPKLRRAVEWEALCAGLTSARADELALAVNEIATNALLHGLPPAVLRIWIVGDELICEISDAGEGVKDALAGQLRPPLRSVGGRGIWLARQLCDAVEIRNGTGCTVAVRAAAPSRVTV